MFVPEIILHGRPDDFGNTGLIGKNKDNAVVGGLKSSKAKWLGDRTHHENISEGVNIAEFLATDEAGKDDVFGDAKLCGEFDQAVSFFAVASKDKDEFVILANGKSGGTKQAW